MRIRFYGKLGERLGAEVDFIPPPGTDTVEELRRVLAETYPGLAIDLRARTFVCVADSLVANDRKITDGEIVEFLPPLSGG